MQPRLNTSGSQRPAFIIGPGLEGHWIALEVHGRGGGIFNSLQAARRFAEFETGHCPDAVRVTAQPMRLTY